MRILIQRVKKASVTIDGKAYSSIESGLLVFAGIEEEDNPDDVSWLAGKLVNLRIFNDSSGIMNLSAKDAVKEIMVVSQFTLHASTKKGNRPSYVRAASPLAAIPLYDSFINEVERLSGKKVMTGIFGAMMDVALINDGPVTIFIDSKKRE